MPSEKRKIIFLDRDGVINKERGEFTWKLEDFILNDHLFEALNILKKNSFERSSMFLIKMICLSAYVIHYICFFIFVNIFFYKFKSYV